MASALPPGFGPAPFADDIMRILALLVLFEALEERR
jgi:hypothetical protein